MPASLSTPYFLHLGLIYSTPGDANFGFTDPQFAHLDGGLARILYTPAANGRRQMNQMSTRHAFATNPFPGFRIPSIQDRNIFDYYNLLYMGDTNFTSRDFRAGTVSLEQGLWDDRAGLVPESSPPPSGKKRVELPSAVPIRFLYSPIPMDRSPSCGRRLTRSGS